MEQSEKIKIITPLMFCTLIVATASIIYELIIAGISSYLLGNSIYQFSITIGLFMSFMGFGSLFSKKLHNKLMKHFLIIEILLALIGGLTGFLLFYTFAMTNVYQIVMYILTLTIGFLTGIELPLLTRVIKKYDNLKVVLANVMSVDYIGGLVGSVIFPIYLLPKFGFITTSYIIGLLNLLVAITVYLKYKEEFSLTKVFLIPLLVVAIILSLGVTQVKESEKYLEQKMYQDKVVYSEQSKYQKIVITHDNKGEDTRLYLNGNIQFSSKDEYRYHESLIHPALSLLKEPKKVLVLGGGDGLVAKHLLQYNSLKRIDIVDLDKAVTDLGQNNQYLLEVNNNSFANKKVKVYNQDAYSFIEDKKRKYDVIISDLPDPNNESLNKLYTVEFYHMIYNHLNSKGVFVTQSTSPYFAPKSFWQINKSINQSAFEYVKPYHANVPSFGDWGFNIATKGFDFKAENINLKVKTEFLSERKIPSLFVFGKDIKKKRKNVVRNTLIRPTLIIRYNNEWDNY